MPRKGKGEREKIMSTNKQIFFSSKNQGYD
jgi:hypothetical protein